MKWFYLLFLASLAACNSTRQSVKIILLPDTQTYAEKYPYILDSQVNWILRNKAQISFVLQQGDLTQNNSHKEWAIVKRAFDTLNHKVPYVLAAGNHDMGSADGKYADVRNTKMFNQYFPLRLMHTLPGFAGTFAGDEIENAFYTFTTGHQKWLVVTLEFGPRNSVLQWADSLVKKFPSHTVIINTHCYMYSDSTRNGAGDKWRPQAYGIGKDSAAATVNDGDDIWKKLVLNNKNIRFVFSGHILNSGVGTLISFNAQGLPVYQMLANFQEGVTGSVNGGNGFLRILDLNLKKRSINVSCYSPFTGKYNSDPQHNFLIKHAYFGAN